MLRYFVAGNLWLFVMLYCYIERLHGRLISDAGVVPLIAAFVCFALYWLTSPAIPFRFSVRSLLMAMALVAVFLALFVMLLG